MAQQLRFVSSKRGNRKLCHEGFSYQKKNQSATTIYWYCDQRETTGCRGALKTAADLEGEPRVRWQ